jgi:mannose-6-phosphate isomerase-like protein (cupin superfamily)
MPTSLDPVRVDRATALHLPAATMSLHVLDTGADYWDHMQSRPELADGRILSVFTYNETWTWWERHPVGDEFAHLLSGEVRLLIDNDVEQHSLDLDEGQSAIIPAGYWHSLEIGAPSRLLFITPTPARTEHRPL